ncbi:hypothetical protein NITGR_150057 [Nitrospina gracilis 3/211]|uniref:Uncharacterized protein n=1 Tax=Nitrospina gracilis (strain 3/211) TaxID=1266370 RepID=M1YW54_NITG3|nr:hypothetical protein [Nitrospina gracilis]MCF8722741.1 hypothetical protein [Nitrospina sp. Nb-3]CCQ89689.1 hypothetical protein NITGR_150057 [Nitrospina gracilis 3/211]
MVKFCLQCKDAFWGGKFCPNCEGDIELLDAAVPENQKYLGELNIDVRPKYFARSSMLLTCFGFVMALPLGMFVFLRGASASGNVALWATLGISLVLGVAWLTWWGSAKVFSRKMKDVHTLKEPQLD